MNLALKNNGGKKKLNKRKIFIALILFFMVWFLCPIIGGVFHIGMVYPVIILAVPLFALSFPEKAKALWNGKAKFFVRFLSACLCAGILFIMGIVGWMGYSAMKPTQQNATVVILGCKVRGEAPSRMLVDRAKKAIEYLNENPASVCIASGGQGDGEDISEAEALRRYLVANGIEEDRIYLEDKSTSTYENITFTASIIKENNLSANIVVASDNFHQLRASIFAERNGLKASPIGTNTWIFLLPGYWAREALGIVKALVFGN